MASFSFGAGNVAKLARIPLYLAGRLATLLVPRSRGRWVFGCAVGIADGALALWECAVDTHGENARWLTADAAQDAAARARGIPTVRKDSLRGFWETARAGVVVVTHGFGDANRYATTGAFVVQLWHGIPLKRIGLDAPVTTRSPILPAVTEPLLRALYRRTQRRISLLPAASHLVRGRLESAFALPDGRVPVTGEPRVDVLARGDVAGRRRTAREQLGALTGPLADDTRAILYAPTWRDGAADPAVPTAADWALLDEMLAQTGAVLYIRSHPLGAGDYRTDSPRVRALGSAVTPDVTPLLPAFDVLVTDYSSLVFDASLVPVPAVLLAPDGAAYALERGFYGTLADVAAAPATDWTGAVAQLRAVLTDDAERARRTAHAQQLDARVHAYRDGGATERVYRAITARRHPERAGR
ncbi:CDP-glycerol glycerophosphotransferase family protein [Microbacterium sp. W1N]|uniref:CDP-glycerol glycerophosphotransferase family protein n=1 Tax=Microbacterium festucae TaxID=2977531 RepID=UPI0021C0F01D|nr:CDP-glycerol glycerophosphotransferase family protein [Microbacterium festucae]MCT9820421.1 CDP-glycerol glycerophosphotransferase family protein [Microbacterium festucae]